jgi:hypothetical protein
MFVDAFSTFKFSGPKETLWNLSRLLLLDIRPLAMFHSDEIKMKATPNTHA